MRPFLVLVGGHTVGDLQALNSNQSPFDGRSFFAAQDVRLEGMLRANGLQELAAPFVLSRAQRESRSMNG
jgi:hypothetical protein